MINPGSKALFIQARPLQTFSAVTRKMKNFNVSARELESAASDARAIGSRTFNRCGGHSFSFLLASTLPVGFRSLYRLLLRANSAAVLHHSPSKTQVHRLWRPVFDEAALKIHRLQHRDVLPAEREHIVQWLYTWHKRGGLN